MASQRNRCPWRVWAVAGPRRGHQGVITSWGGRAPHILQPLHVQSVHAAPLSPPRPCRPVSVGAVCLLAAASR